MERIVGENRGRIIWVTSKKVDGGISVPPELSLVTDKELIENYKVVNGLIKPKNLDKDMSKLKVAIVGVWKIPCGISTYTEYLVPEIAPLISDYKIFCEIADGVEDEHAVPCWSRGGSLIECAEKIKEYKPDVVMIQHEYGIFPDARKWLSFMTALSEFKVYVALHSVYRHEDKLICEASIQNIIVHTDLAKEVLLEKGVTNPIFVIPHGCLPPENKPRLWNLYRSKHTFMQFGFGFEYKGWENALEACALLKKEFHDVYFTGLFSESKFSKNLHDRYFQKLMDLVKTLGIEDNVSLLRGFQSEKVLDSFFRINKCAVFPYVENGEHTVFGVTGAARVAMKSGIPVVTSTVPFFYDLKSACRQANGPAALAESIKDAWDNPSVESQDKFLIENSWSAIAIKYLDAMLS